MIKDSFILNENIKINIVICVIESSIDIEVVIENKSQNRIMLNNYYFKRDRYFYFTDENEIKGKVIPKMQIDYDWSIDNKSIDIIEPGEKIVYKTHQKFEKKNNKYLISSDEDIIEFENPLLIKIFLQYCISDHEMNNMKEIIDDAILVPVFFKNYIIKKF